MSKNFKPLLHDSYNVGKHIKSSKKRFTWKFELDGQEHVVDLYVSKISGKRKVLVDGDIKIQAKKSAIYGSYPLKIGRHNLLINEQIDSVFDLQVDNCSFEAGNQRTRAQSDFRYNDQYQYEAEPNLQQVLEARDPYQPRKSADPFAEKNEPYKSDFSYNDPFQNKSSQRRSLIAETRDPFENRKLNGLSGERRDPFENRRVGLSGERRDPFENRRTGSLAGEKRDPFENRRVDSFRKRPENNEEWERYEDFFDPEKYPYAEKEFGVESQRRESRVIERSTMPAQPSSAPKPVEEKPKEAAKPQDQTNLLDAPYQASTLPHDIFVSNTNTTSTKPTNNPFNGQAALANNFDWNSVAPKPEENKTQPPQTNFPPNAFPMGMPPQMGAQGMQQGQMNPMAAMMAYNQFMTGMMMGQYMNPQQPFR
ncbi:unnamed protein product [Blepharisma stoltei]|uniref:Uncharacterized protein n=1 Tax=Blepharisma stoltei TaxID=1481888 RepID=A0AAU9J3Q8_9CILI|nr:unnamed protein product [Blepharisma stoltei]